jgi:hypothetical protein
MITHISYHARRRIVAQKKTCLHPPGRMEVSIAIRIHVYQVYARVVNVCTTAQSSGLDMDGNLWHADTSTTCTVRAEHCQEV